MRRRRRDPSGRGRAGAAAWGRRGIWKARRALRRRHRTLDAWTRRASAGDVELGARRRRNAQARRCWHHGRRGRRLGVVTLPQDARLGTLRQRGAARGPIRERAHRRGRRGGRRRGDGVGRIEIVGGADGRRGVDVGEDALEVGVREVLHLHVDGHVGVDAASRAALTEARLRFPDVTLVRAFLDLPADADPVHRVGVVLLRHDLEAEPHRRVADLLLAEDRETAVDILARHRRLELLEAEEVLLVDVSKTIDALLELADRDLLLFGVHVDKSSARASSLPASVLELGRRVKPTAA